MNPNNANNANNANTPRTRLPGLSLALGLSLLVGLVASSAACSSSPCEKRHCEAKVTVAHFIDFALEEEDGVTRGFDLDDRVSMDRDAKTCGHGDATSPDGLEGVDNNASVLFDSINALTEASVEELIRGSINEGRLLLTFQLLGLDSLESDDCVDIEIFQAAGSPLVGTDGFILPGQTYDIDTEQPRTSIKCGKVKDGVLTAGPFDGNLFVSILGVHVNLTLNSAKLSANLGKNGVEDMVLGAGINIDELHDLLTQTNDRTLDEIGHFLIDTLADMGADERGQCQQLSATVVMGATNAYLF